MSLKFSIFWKSWKILFNIILIILSNLFLSLCVNAAQSNSRQIFFVKILEFVYYDIFSLRNYWFRSPRDVRNVTRYQVREVCFDQVWKSCRLSGKSLNELKSNYSRKTTRHSRM